MDYTTNLGLKKPAYSDPADIVDINDNMDIIDKKVASKEDIGTITYEIIDNVFVNKDTGAETPINAYCSTDYIELTVGLKISIKTKVSNDLSGICFYSESKGFISGYNPYSDNETLTELNIPNGAKYVRVPCLTAYKSNFELITTGIVDAIIALDDVRVDVAKIKGGEYYNISENVDYTVGEYINNYGEIRPLAVYSLSDPIHLKKGEQIYVSAYVASAGAVSYLSKCKEDGTYISTIKLSQQSSTSILEIAEYEAVDDNEWVRISYYNNHNSTIPVVKKTNIEYAEVRDQVFVNAKDIDKLKNIENVAHSFWSRAIGKVLCIGDSLTSGAYFGGNWNGASIDQNYPRMLGRMLNAEVTNGGVSGYSASDWWSNKISQYTLSNYDTFIIWLGTNNGLTDTLETDVEPYDDYEDFATTETGYYCKIIAKIKEENPDALIVLTKIFASKGNVPTTNAVIEKIATKYSLLVVDNSDLGQVAHPELHLDISNPHFGKAGNIFIANRYVTDIGDWFAENPLRCEYGLTARTN